jgi:hypothetical protein
MTVVSESETPGETVTLLSNMIIEYGFGPGSSLSLNGVFTVTADAETITIVSSTVAITGGTGIFLGAKGDAVFSPPQDVDKPLLAKLNIYVPGLPKPEQK